MSRPGIVNLWLFYVKKNSPSFRNIQYTKITRTKKNKKINKPFTQVNMPKNIKITMQDVDLILLIMHDIVYILLPCLWCCLVDAPYFKCRETFWRMRQSWPKFIINLNAMLTHIILSLTHVKNSAYDELENNIVFFKSKSLIFPYMPGITW